MLTQFKAGKRLILTNANPIGDATFYGYALLAGAGYSCLVVFILWVIYVTSANKKFDYTVLKWK